MSSQSAYTMLKEHYSDLSPKMECNVNKILAMLGCSNHPQYSKISCLENSENEFNKCMVNIKKNKNIQ